MPNEFEVITNEKFAFMQKATPEQIAIAYDFIKIVFNDDINKFWDFLSTMDQSRIYGLYEANLHYDDSINLQELLIEIRESVRGKYIKVKENAGISSTARFTHDGEIYMYLFEDIDVSITYIAETPANVFPIVLAPDVKVKDEQFILEYKVRVYDDKFRNLSF